MSQLTLISSAASKSTSNKVWIELWLSWAVLKYTISWMVTSMYIVDSVIKQHNLIIRSENHQVL